MNKPKDVSGECNAHIYIGDDWGDGTATFRCDLPKGHKCQHRDLFNRGVMFWNEDERDYNIYEECEPCKGWGFVEAGDLEREWWGFVDAGECKVCKGHGRIIVGNEKDLDSSLR